MSVPKDWNLPKDRRRVESGRFSVEWEPDMGGLIIALELSNSLSLASNNA